MENMNPYIDLKVPYTGLQVLLVNNCLFG